MKTIQKIPSIWAVCRAIGWVTFLEIVRDKVLYNVLVCSLLLFGVGLLASRLNFLSPDRVILDFGLMSVGISSSLIAVFVGSGLLAEEFKRRTIYVALSHPISRAQFILGKFLGLVGVLAVNWGLMTISYFLFLFFFSLERLNVFSVSLFWAVFFYFIQSIVLGSIAILFSTFSTTSLSASFSIGIYLVGINISQVQLLVARSPASFGRSLLSFLTTLLPNFEHFNLGIQVTYGLPVSWQFASLSILYGLFVITMCLALAGVFIQNREV